MTAFDDREQRRRALINLGILREDEPYELAPEDRPRCPDIPAPRVVEVDEEDDDGSAF